jgi:hypothetical protein
MMIENCLETGLTFEEDFLEEFYDGGWFEICSSLQRLLTLVDDVLFSLKSIKKLVECSSQLVCASHDALNCLLLFYINELVYFQFNPRHSLVFFLK